MSWTASDALIEFVLGQVAPGQTILELGSGESTRKFIEAERNVITVENDPAWLHKVTSGERARVTYLHAPIKEYEYGANGEERRGTYRQLHSIRKRCPHVGWYNPDILQELLRDKHYDLILVDGPLGAIGRSGFLQHLDIFPILTCPIVFDDQHRIDDLYVAECVARHLKRDLVVTNNGLDTQPFSFLMPLSASVIS